MIRRALLALVVLLGALVAPSAPAAPQGEGANIAHVANISWGRNVVGTDVEFATIGGRDYAFAGTYRSGLKVVDITDPRRPERVASYPCGIAQGDVQVFRGGPKTYVAYTSDDGYGPVSTGSQCFRDAGADGFQRYGTFFIDVSDPRRPRAVSFLGIARGSHNATVHPGGQWMYSSNADLDSTGTVEVVDISRVERPTVTRVLDLVTGLSAHDITFSADGKRAYVAAVSHSLVLDTTDPGAPRVIGRIVDPTINIHHQADPVTIADPVLGPRTYVIVTDELAGAAGNLFCPGGGLHVYDITGPLETAPVKVGFFAVPEVRVTDGDSITCTSHVLQIHEKQKLMTIAWYAAGVRVLDLSNLVGASVGLGPETGSVGAGIREVGWYRFPSSDTWSAKTNRIAADGSFFIFGNDVLRGFDVYRYTPTPTDAQLPSPGTWLLPHEVPTAPRLDAYRPFCLLPR